MFFASRVIRVQIGFATLLSLVALPALADEQAAANRSGQLLRSLKEPLTSFGAAVFNEYLYVFSGHDGEAHGFGRDSLSNHFRRIRFDDPDAEWEDLPMHAPAQSVAIVTDGEYIYRVGGLSFLNNLGGDETEFNSTTHFARYDTEAREWTELPALPNPRSSLDAAVLGRHIYVAGGWNLQGNSSSDAPWYETMLRFDLDHPDAGWETLPGPGYKSRAISMAAHDGKIYFIGGIQQRGITRKVSVFDTESETWSAGPELPADSATAGFATSSFATGGHLYVTGGSGVVYRLNAAADAWTVANRLFYPRMFLRLVPADESRLLAVGGTGTGSVGRMAVVESVNVDVDFQQPYKMTRWSIDFGGRAKHSQALYLAGNKLYAFGGNASRKPHDFSQQAFLNEAYAFDIAGRDFETLPALPHPMQSGAAVVNRQTSEHQTIAVLGGLGFDSGPSSLSSVQLYDPESKQWKVATKQLPEPRSMFEAVAFDDAIWCFGGATGTGSALLTDVIHWWGDDSELAPLHEVTLPTPRRSFATARLDRELFLIGGLGEGNQITGQVDVFHFDDRSWRTIASPTYDRVFPSVAVVNGKIYLFGGFSSEGGHFSPANALEVYDPKTDAWEIVEKELVDISNSMQMLAYNNRLLFYGVDSDVDGQANFILLDPNPRAVPQSVTTMSFGSPRGGGASSETARLLIRRDTNKDGKLSREELGSRLAYLLDGDENGDDLLSIEELKSKLQSEPKSGTGAN